MLKVSLSNTCHESHDELCFDFIDGPDLYKRSAFSVPKDFHASNDTLAAVAIAIRPVVSDKIELSFPISLRAKEIAMKSYGIELICPVSRSNAPMPRSKTYLNFSGGVDSLAAHRLLGDSTQKLSIDFGGAFAREAEWFREWETFIARTDFRKKPFIESLDWRFMAAPAILFADYLEIETLCWGTVLEASPFWLSSVLKTNAEKSNATHVFAIANLKVAQTVSPLSEYGTMKVAATLGENILNRSINSCAPLHSEKFLRKQLLKQLVLQRLIDNSFFEEYKIDRKHQFGSSFGADVLTLYFCWRIGTPLVQEYIADISDKYLQKIYDMDMGFFEKYNPANTPALVPHLREKIIAGYEDCGIRAYNDNDFNALTRCREFFSTIHKFL